MATNQTTQALADARAKQLATVDSKNPQVQVEKALMAWSKEFQMAMPAGMEAVQLVRDIMHALRTNTDLALCSRESLLGAAMNCAQLGLRPGVAGLAWIVPFKKQAQLIVGYKGMVQLAYKHPAVASVDGRIVREGDDFEYSFRPKVLRHSRPDTVAFDAAPTHYYVVVDTTRGGEVWEVLTDAEGEKLRQAIVGGKGGATKPWNTYPEAMKLKTAMRRLAKWSPMSLELEVATVVDGGVRLDPSPDVRPEDATVIDSETVADALPEGVGDPLKGQGS